MRRFSKPRTDVPIGIGDDAAALKIHPRKLLLATADSQVEGIHFIVGLIPPRALARKAVAVAVSDIGAMGGEANFFLSSLGLPKGFAGNFFLELMEGFKHAEEEFQISLVGGNLSAADKLFLDITALGEVEPELAVKRVGASVGDEIFATGTLGDSALGLEILTKKHRRQTASDEFLIGRHIAPQPRLGVGRVLAIAKIPSAMIDVSDGLILDLERITVRHGLGAEIVLDKIPLSEAYRGRSLKILSDFHTAALSGGEDYELLFTASPARRGEIDEISRAQGVAITAIGRVTPETRIKILNADGGEIALPGRRGFIHFQE